MNKLGYHLFYASLDNRMSNLDRVNKLKSRTLDILASYYSYTIKNQMLCLTGVNS